MAKKTQKLPVASKKPIPVKIVNDVPKSSEKKYQAEDDLRTLKSYSDLQKDKGRLSAAKSLGKEQLKALEKACK